MKFFQYLFLIILLSVLSGCGFHLKGSANNYHLPKTIDLILAQPDNKLQSILQDALENRGISLEKSASYRIKINHIEYEKIASAIGRSQQASHKEITLIDRFKAEIFFKNQLIGERMIQSQSIVRYRSNAYLGSSKEEENTHHRLAYDNAEKLIRFIAATIQ